jgi:hypothetical protein
MVFFYFNFLLLLTITNNYLQVYYTYQPPSPSSLHYHHHQPTNTMCAYERMDTLAPLAASFYHYKRATALTKGSYDNAKGPNDALVLFGPQVCVFFVLSVSILLTKFLDPTIQQFTMT